MDWHVWLAYFLAAWLIALSPGSGAVLSMSHGLQYGVRQTTATIVGLQIGYHPLQLTAIHVSAGRFFTINTGNVISGGAGVFNNTFLPTKVLLIRADAQVDTGNFVHN
mgnify:CR=1 FL=1